MSCAQFQPVIEAASCNADAPWPWPIADVPGYTEFVLNARMSDDEVGSMVGALCDPLEIEASTDSSAYFDALNQIDYFSLRGGLALIDESGILISRGCCTGIEDWRELHSIARRQSPWMGHDPAPWCEFPDSDTVNFWSSGGLTGQRVAPMVSYSHAQVATELARFHRALKETAVRLRQWLNSMKSRCTDTLVVKFEESFAVTTEEPLYKIIG